VDERPVAPHELFFDLVFAFAFTQVTTLLSERPTWLGLARALLVLGALWWAWASFAWLTNTIDTQDGVALAAILAATGAIFIAALAVPDAFGGEGVLFGGAFLVASVTQVALYAWGARGEPDLLRAIVRVFPWVIGGAVLILAAGFAHGGLRIGLWAAALVVGFVGPGLIDVRGWRVRPSHFVERHGLIVIIAIGESLIAVGVGVRGIDLTVGVVTGAVLGLVVATSFWLAYFDFFTSRARQLLEERRDEEQVLLARDVFTYLHLPMVVGIVLFAFGVKSALPHLGGHLSWVAAVAVCGGPALFLGSFVALRYRVSRSLGRGRLAATVACALLIPLTPYVPALAALALVAAVWVALHAYELVWWRDARAQARAQR